MRTKPESDFQSGREKKEFYLKLFTFQLWFHWCKWVKWKVLYEKKTCRASFIFCNQRETHMLQKRRNPSFWWGQARECLLLDTDGMGDCAVHHPRGPHASLEPVSSGIISQPVPIWYAARPKQGGQACWTATSMACQVNYTFSLAALSRRTPAHSVQLKYIQEKSKFTTNLARAFQLTCNCWKNIMRNTELDCENCYASPLGKPCNSKMPSDMSKNLPVLCQRENLVRPRSCLKFIYSL